MDNLNWEVFVTPGMPVVTRDRPPGISETFFQAMASTLICGNKDAVLVHAYMPTFWPALRRTTPLPHDER
jgi:hypothetical protein